MEDTASTDDQALLGRDEAHEVFKQFASYYDAPAYVRRARQVEDAFGQLLARCRGQRDEWLRMVRVRLGLLRMQAGDWSVLLPWLEDDGQIDLLERLHIELAPRLRIRLDASASERSLRRSLRELAESIVRFNRRWTEFLPTVDLAPVNALRDGYNRYYLLEKECAIRSPQLARQGFRRLEPLTLSELEGHLPALPMLRIRG
jgi:hypothetical protein